MIGDLYLAMPQGGESEVHERLGALTSSYGMMNLHLFDTLGTVIAGHPGSNKIGQREQHEVDDLLGPRRTAAGSSCGPSGPNRRNGDS